MSSKISEILEEIIQLEDKLEKEIMNHEAEFFYRLEGTKIKFEHVIEQAHRKLKVGIFRWLCSSNPLNVLSAPIIYSMIFPFMLLDLTISLYQAICFPLYRITKVERKNYIVIDRHHLSYLNSIEKLNCIYCGYINGLITYSREIVARTEQYWCPIKHAKKVLATHKRYTRFSDFGDPLKHHQHISNMRELLTTKEI